MTVAKLLTAMLSLGVAKQANRKVILAPQGVNCESACAKQWLQCIPSIDTGNSPDLFKQLGVDCSKPPAQGGKWWAADQPSYVSDPSDPNYGECLGYVNVPPTLPCTASMSATRRLCNCGDPIPTSSDLTFSTGRAGVDLTLEEQIVFSHKIPSNSTGMMNHFWSTADPEAETDMIVRYYVDGETTPSIAFRPPLAAGVGFDDGTAPWGTKWMGLGAGNGGNGQAWFHNFKIPFTSSIQVSVQATVKKSGGFYIIVRGGLNLPLVIGDVRLPPTAKLQLQTFDGPMKPLDVLDVAHVPAGYAGQLFLSTLAVNNDGTGGLNFLEGCFHMYDPVDAAFPGTVLSTGTEDYYDSGWYFNAGTFHMPVSGLTHMKTEKTVTEWSAYRFHEMDPVRFQNGFRFTWRCGDEISKDPNVGKCYTQSGGDIVGSPTCDRVQSYAWVYVWPNK